MIRFEVFEEVIPLPEYFSEAYPCTPVFGDAYYAIMLTEPDTSWS